MTGRSASSAADAGAADCAGAGDASGAGGLRADWTLRLRDVCVVRSGRRVLDGVHFDVRAGDCVTVIGPNGAGKSTLMLTLLGLLPPASGTVELDGRPLAALTARQRGRLAAYVPQITERLPPLRVYDVVATGRFPYSRALHPLSAADQRVIADALERCGLTDLASRPASELSGGERQKTLLAAAIAQDADMLCLDEPTTALDPGRQIELVGLLRDWHARGRTLVLVSHDLQLPTALGGRVAALRGGRVIADGRPEEVLTTERLREIFGAGLRVCDTGDGGRLVVPEWGGGL